MKAIQAIQELSFYAADQVHDMTISLDPHQIGYPHGTEFAYPPQVMEKMRRFVAGSQLHLNKGGLKFDQVGRQMQVAAVGWAYGACLADLDNDGWLDIYATAGYISRNRDEPDG